MVKDGYKQTEGRITLEEWTKVTVNDLKAPFEHALATGPFGSSISARFFQEDGIPVIRGSNLSHDVGIKLNDDGLVYISLEKSLEFKRSIARTGDLIFTCWGTINQVGLIDSTAKYLEYVISNKQMKFTPDPGKADSLFLYYLFSGPDLQRIIKRQNIGSSVPGFNLGQLRELHFEVPLLPEQRAIATALSDVDALIASLDKLIAKKRHLKTAAMQQLLTGKKRLPGFGEGKGYKQTEAGLIPEDWEVLKIKEFAPLQRGFDLPTSQLRKGGYPVVYSNGVTNYHFEFMVDGPGVVTGRSGTIGNVHYVSENYWPHNTTLWVTDFINSYPKYIYYLYKFLKLKRFETGSGVPTLNRNDLHDLKVAIPKLEEQRAISTVLSDMDAEIAALEARRAKTQAIKQGMMQELLTGKTRLIQPTHA